LNRASTSSATGPCEHRTARAGTGAFPRDHRQNGSAGVSPLRLLSNSLSRPAQQLSKRLLEPAAPLPRCLSEHSSGSEPAYRKRKHTRSVWVSLIHERRELTPPCLDLEQQAFRRQSCHASRQPDADPSETAVLIAVLADRLVHKLTHRVSVQASHLSLHAQPFSHGQQPRPFEIAGNIDWNSRAEPEPARTRLSPATSQANPLPLTS
jgi:hypothetical protein